MDPMLKEGGGGGSGRTHSPTLDAQFAASPPRLFALKKWTLVVVMALNLLFIGLVLLCRATVIERLLEMLKPLMNEEALQQVKHLLEIVIPILSLFSLLLIAFFLYGVLRHVLWIVTVYAGFLLIGALATALEALLISPVFWINAALSAAVGLLAVLYARDLQFMQRYNVTGGGGGGGRKRLTNQEEEV